MLGLALTSTLAGVACKGDPATSESNESPSPHAKAGTQRAPSRIESLKLDELGAQPGFLDQGPIYAAVRAGRAQAFLREIPLPGDVIREFARARQEIGFDPLTDDMLARFAIPEDAVISMTLGRPLGIDHIEPIRNGLRRDNRFLTALSKVMQDTEARKSEVVEVSVAIKVEETTRQAVPVPEAIDAPEEPPPPLDESPPPFVPEVPGGVIGGIAYDPGPPPLSPGERREIDELLAHADATALQFHFHIPSDDPDKILTELRTRIPPSELADAKTYCRGLEVEICAAGGRELFIARREKKAVVFDVLLYPGRYNGSAATRLPAAVEALEAPPATLEALEHMAGHASVYFDASAWVQAATLEQTSSAMLSLTWSGDDPRRDVDRRFREVDALRQLFDTTRLFDGLVASVHHERERTQLQASWLIGEGQQKLAQSTLTPPPIRVAVPSLAALCEGALLCGRSRGVPSPQQLGTSLGLGVYGNADALDDALGQADEAGAFLLLISTWPNALGTASWQLPLAEARGPEAALVRGLLDAIARIQGMGISVRSIEIDRRSLQAEYALYARVPASDLSLVSTLLAMAEMRLTPTTVDGIEGEVRELRIPEDDVPAVLMTREDSELLKNEEGKEIRHGWLALVDRPDRLAWLLNLSTDEGIEPMLYFEIADLWRLVSSVPDAAEELGFARTWASGRVFKAALVLDKGQPQLTMEIALLP